MTAIYNHTQRSIVFKSSLIVLVIALCIGAMLASLTFLWESRREESNAVSRLNALLSTAEEALSIACYLSNENLSRDVAKGLFKHDDVGAIRVIATDQALSNKILSQLEKNKPKFTHPQRDRFTMKGTRTISRSIYSPFNPSEKVCDVELAPNEEHIQEQINSQSLLFALFLVLYALIIGGILMIVVTKMITSPMKAVSRLLHELPPDSSAKLNVPEGHQQDELGQLVRDINMLSAKLFGIIKDERELRIEHQIGERKFRAIFDNAESGIFLLKHNGDVLSHNKAYTKIFDLNIEELEDNNEPIKLSSKFPQYGLRLHGMIESALHNDVIASEDFIIETRHQEKKWINLVLSRVDDGLLQGVINDITERKLIEESVNQLAMTDRLTGIANRLGFEKHMARMEFEIQAEAIRNFYLFMIDLDGFKHVNDIYGHDSGDKVLINFAQLLKMIVRKNDFIGRLGGDEFIVVLKDIEQIDSIKQIAQKIITETSQSYFIDKSVEIRIGASIGIACVNTPEFDLADTLHCADEAMYQAKRQGKNQFAIHENPPSDQLQNN